MTTAHSPTSPRGSFGRLDASSAWNLILERQVSGRLTIFDVRDRRDYDAQRIEGALHLTERDFPRVVQVVPQGETILVHCYHGHASQSFAAMFSDFGYSDVHSVDGGFEALVAEYKQRSAPDQADEHAVPELPRRYVPGDVVYALGELRNDGGVPELAEDALVAPAGRRGVVVKYGYTEAEPKQLVYAVRFEDDHGELGPELGCLPEELTQGPVAD